MANIVKKVGDLVGRASVSHPTAARRMLAFAFGAYDAQLLCLPPKDFAPYEDKTALVTTRWIHRCLSHTSDAAVVSIFTPCEYLNALDRPVIFTEGLAGFMNGIFLDQAMLENAHGAGIPRSLCSYHQILLGAARSGMLDTPRYILCTSTCCDANASTFRTLADWWHIPIFQVDVPQKENAETVAYVARQLRQMKTFIEQQEGRKIPDDKLYEIVRTEQENRRLQEKCMELLAQKKITRSLTVDMYSIFLPLVMAGTKASHAAYETFVDDLIKAPSSDPDTIRLMWVHSIPFWQDSMRELIMRDPKVQFLISDMNLVYQDEAFDPEDMDHLEEFLGRRLIRNYYAGPLCERTKAAAKNAKIMNADGIVWFAHWGCHHTQGAGPLAKKQLEEAGLPTLVLDGDGADRSNVNDGQMKTKLQAFLEMLREQKGARA